MEALLEERSGVITVTVYNLNDAIHLPALIGQSSAVSPPGYISFTRSEANIDLDVVLFLVSLPESRAYGTLVEESYHCNTSV
jgi:hypothetical protein